jgi:hypothetical protein
MPYLFLIAGSVMVISAVRGTQATLLSLLKGDFTGKNNFVYWLISILIIGALGYIQELRPVSRAFLILVVIVLFLDNKGVFAQFNQAIGTTQLSQTGPIGLTGEQTLNQAFNVPTPQTVSVNPDLGLTPSQTDTIDTDSEF